MSPSGPAAGSTSTYGYCSAPGITTLPAPVRGVASVFARHQKHGAATRLDRRPQPGAAPRFLRVPDHLPGVRSPGVCPPAATLAARGPVQRMTSLSPFVWRIGSEAARSVSDSSPPNRPEQRTVAALAIPGLKRTTAGA